MTTSKIQWLEYLKTRERFGFDKPRLRTRITKDGRSISQIYIDSTWTQIPNELAEFLLEQGVIKHRRQTRGRGRG